MDFICFCSWDLVILKGSLCLGFDVGVCPDDESYLMIDEEQFVDRTTKKYLMIDEEQFWF